MTSRLQRLVLVRHGETVGQSSIRYYGATDIALSTAGLQQMKAVGKALAHEQFDLILSSAMQRALIAADLIVPGKAVQAVRGFNEIDFGDWEGLTKEEIAARDPRGFARWQADLHRFTYPGGDSVLAFRARVVDTWHTLLPTVPERVLLIAHRGVILTVIADLLQLSEDARANWPTALGSIHVLERSAGGWSAACANRTDHLQEGA